MNPLFANRWLCDKTWHNLLIARYPNFEYIGNASVGLLTQSIKKNHVGPFDVTANAKGVYYATFNYAIVLLIVHYPDYLRYARSTNMLIRSG